MSKLPSICFVAPQAYPILASNTSINIVGGAEVQQCCIAKNLAKRGFITSMICLDYGQPNDLVIDGVRVFKTHKPDGGIPVLRFIHPRITSLWQALKKVDAEIYYQRCASQQTGLVSFFCRHVKKKMIFSVASDLDLIPGQQLIRYKRDKLLYEWGLKHADVIIVQNPQQQILCKKNYNKGSVVIRSCYENSSNNQDDDKQIDVLWVGTIKLIKRPEIFIELAQRMPEYSFRMIGGSSNGNNHEFYYCKIKEQASKVSNLDFWGFVPLTEIDKHFNKARLFVNSSKWEGFPNTFLQSWIRGIPTVAFINPDAIFEGEQVGVKVNSIDDMVHKIKELLACTQKYELIGNICKKYAEQFHSPEKIVDEYSKLFTSIIC